MKPLHSVILPDRYFVQGTLPGRPCNQKALTLSIATPYWAVRATLYFSDQRQRLILLDGN